MMPLCKDRNVGVIPYNPTAVGVLSGRYLREGELVIRESDVKRLQPDDEFAPAYYGTYIAPPENAEIVKRVVELAAEKGVKPVQIGLAWLFHKGVVAPIIGTASPEHVEEAVGSLDIKLSDQETLYLEEPYKPKQVRGHI